ncbi:MAG: hypothetical protein ABSA65_05175 [Acidimicrobiales bacterium]
MSTSPYPYTIGVRYIQIEYGGAEMRTDIPETDFESVELEIAINRAMSSIDSRMDPISRAVAASRVAERLNNGLAWAAERRSRAVATAVVMPGMSMQKVADELGVSKSMVAKLAGPASVRDEIAADMRGRLQAASEYGAHEGSGRRR